MSKAIDVHKNRANVVTVDLGIDVSTDIITSEIRDRPHWNGLLLATWTVTMPNGGVDGLIELTLDATTTGQVDATSGFMDLKRILAGVGDPVAVFEDPLEVRFVGSVTA